MSFFKRPATHYGKTPEPETPYQRAAQIWDDRIGSARVQARNWRLMAFGCLILSAGFAAALVWQSARGTIVPWVVQVDNLGQAQAVAPAQADYRPTDPQAAAKYAKQFPKVELFTIDAAFGGWQKASKAHFQDGGSEDFFFGRLWLNFFSHIV